MGEKRNVCSPIERTRLGHQRGRDRHALRELRDLARRAVVRGVRLRHRDEPFVDVVRDDDRVRASLLRAPRLLDEKTLAAVDEDDGAVADAGGAGDVRERAAPERVGGVVRHLADDLRAVVRDCGEGWTIDDALEKARGRRVLSRRSRVARSPLTADDAPPKSPIA